MKLNKINKIFIIIIAISICIFLLYLLTNNKKEEFITLKSTTYSDATITDYNNYITKLQADAKEAGKTIRPVAVENLQKMGVPESDVENYIKTGSWVWSTEFTNVMKQTELNTPNTGQDETSITNAIIEAQKIYPELYFVGLYGLFYGLAFSQVAKANNLGCKIDPTTKKTTGDSMYTLDASGNVSTTAVNNNQLPTLIPGFTFLNSPCNPCDILNFNYSCAFAIPDEQKQAMFPGFIMEYAWGDTLNTNTNTSNDMNSITNSIAHLF